MTEWRIVNVRIISNLAPFWSRSTQPIAKPMISCDRLVPLSSSLWEPSFQYRSVTTKFIHMQVYEEGGGSRLGFARAM